MSLQTPEKFDIRTNLRNKVRPISMHDFEKMVSVAAEFVFDLLEQRDEMFKREIKHPKHYPSPYPNHL